MYAMADFLYEVMFPETQKELCSIQILHVKSEHFKSRNALKARIDLF